MLTRCKKCSTPCETAVDSVGRGELVHSWFICQQILHNVYSTCEYRELFLAVTSNTISIHNILNGSHHDKVYPVHSMNDQVPTGCWPSTSSTTIYFTKPEADTRFISLWRAKGWVMLTFHMILLQSAVQSIYNMTINLPFNLCLWLNTVKTPW